MSLCQDKSSPVAEESQARGTSPTSMLVRNAERLGAIAMLPSSACFRDRRLVLVTWITEVSHWHTNAHRHALSVTPHVKNGGRGIGEEAAKA